MRRVALISGVLGLLIVGDGVYQLLANYNSGETQDLLHLGKVMLPDGLTLIISGAVVLVVAVIAFLLPARSPQQKA